jgi:hypothetical protein
MGVRSRLCPQCLVAWVRLDFGEVAKQLPANSRATILGYGEGHLFAI